MAIELEKFAWPGGYTILYVFEQSRDNLVLCWECATKAINGLEQGDEKYDGYHRKGSYVNWEGESSWCDDCGVELPSEYGNPDSEEVQVDAGELACEKTTTTAILPDEEEPLTHAEIRHIDKLLHGFANEER